MDPPASSADHKEAFLLMPSSELPRFIRNHQPGGFFRCNAFRLILYVIIAFVLAIFVFDVSVLFYSYSDNKPECPLDHPASTAPLNYVEITHRLHSVVQEKRQEQNFSNHVLTTTVNEAAARYNLPVFLETMKHVQPPMQESLIVFCLDDVACKICASLHVPSQCILMEMGLSSTALVPGGRDASHKDYVRLNYGRVYTTVVLTELGVNTLPVDVDAIFLKNPFAAGNGIAERPHDIAVVQDVKPFRFDIRDKVPINGGFIYFPAGGKKFQYVREFVNRVWDRNCRWGNEQLVFSSMLRTMHKKYILHRSFTPHMLSPAQYLNFCSADCGTKGQFKSVQTYEELMTYDERFGKKTDYAFCSPEGRKQWVYFHVACVNFTHISKSEVVPLKGKLQHALYKWATGVELTSPQVQVLETSP